ncbi:hypothetical protein GOODEAATRI_014670 [Goodea atripinnis]|uniref:Uncharacterized protein n=1 Tax=Goodea atripinnis TaxID=208336 RepID=A0ABV0NCZ4_9TELE
MAYLFATLLSKLDSTIVKGLVERGFLSVLVSGKVFTLEVRATVKDASLEKVEREREFQLCRETELKKLEAEMAIRIQELELQKGSVSLSPGIQVPMSSTFDGCLVGETLSDPCSSHWSSELLPGLKKKMWKLGALEQWRILQSGQKAANIFLEERYHSDRTE